MDDLTTIITFTFPTEAHLAKGFLESNGIQTIMKDEMTVQVNNFYSNAVGGVKLLVKGADYKQGIELLKEGGYIRSKESSKDYKVELVRFDDLTNNKICPFCKSDNIGRNKKANILMIPFFILMTMFLPIYSLSLKCFDCSKEWKFKR